jgi:hypothetical protein
MTRGLELPLTPSLIKEGEEAKEQGAFVPVITRSSQRMTEFSRGAGDVLLLGGHGGVPHFFKVPQEWGI